MGDVLSGKPKDRCGTEGKKTAMRRAQALLYAPYCGHRVRSGPGRLPCRAVNMPGMRRKRRRVMGGAACFPALPGSAAVPGGRRCCEEVL